MTYNNSSPKPHRVLVIGASFGLLPAAKIAAAGHQVTVVGRADEVDAITRHGVAIQFDANHILRPPMGEQGLSFSTPAKVELAQFDLVLLAVQEPQARSADLRALILRIADKIPVASIMNMPPPPFLARIPTLPDGVTDGAYEHPEVWNALPPERMTLASPDPQAIRPDQALPGHLQVTLASNFKFAPFARSEDQAILTRITRDASRLRQEWGQVPVHLLARGSVYAPLAKWPMLVTGNCRCLEGQAGIVSIRDAVHQNLSESRKLYQAVTACLMAIGAPASILVPFERYVEAAQSLSRPSSLALALTGGATSVERIDILVLNLIRRVGRDAEGVAIMADVTARIDQRLARNRLAVPLRSEP